MHFLTEPASLSSFPETSGTRHCGWEQMASPRTAVGSVFTSCRLMGACAWQLGCTWRLISQRLSGILYSAQTIFSLAHPSIVSTSCLAGPEASTAISCSHLVEMKEGQELRQQKSHEKRWQQWCQLERLSWLEECPRSNV